MNRIDIVGRVLKRMDESSPQGNVDELQNVPVETVLDEAARLTLAALPAWLTISKPLEESPKRQEDGSGYIDLPADYLKLAKLWMEGWERPVTVAINELHPSYHHQHNPVLRGGVAKPVVAEVTKDGKRRLEYFSLPSNVSAHEIKQGYYVPLVKAEVIPSTILEPMLWKAAELAFQVMGDGDRMELCSKRFSDSCKSIMQ